MSCETGLARIGHFLDQFRCGAVPSYDCERILDAEDETLVYYRATVMAICVAKAGIRDPIPGS